ncbi:YdgA family protein [uncultured Desulfobacter sp.]|uniref:YdgA family protein n=1 Tax=uncultured Desulfobacter sp. TaxID=240139 RepID=UPI002AAB9482|nr:YdgA family protein [uncultured Desulfobacter sp.]
MKKWLLILIGLAVVCAAGLPIANGIIMEQTVKSVVENNNSKAAKAGTGLKLAILEYDRGLFDSRVKWCVENPSGFPGNDQTRLVFVTRGTHEFFSVDSQTDMKENPWYMQWVNTRLNGQDPLTIQTRFSLAGAMASTIHMNAFVIEDRGKKFDFHPLELEVSMGNGFETLKAQGLWQGASLGSEVVLGPVRFTSDLYPLTDMIWAGKNTFSLEQMKIDDGKSNPVDFSGLSVNFEISAPGDKKTMSMVTDFHVESIELGGKSLADWAGNLKLKHMDTASFDQGMVLYSNLMARTGRRFGEAGGHPGDFQEILKDEMARNTPQLMSVLAGFLKKGLGMEISGLEIDLPEGKVTGGLDLGLKKDLDPSGFFVFAMQPDQIFSFFDLDAQLSLPHALVGSGSNLTDPLFPGMETGLFIIQGDLLSLDVHIREDKLFLNGHQVVLNQ